jgi:hypothetical protein
MTYEHMSTCSHILSSDSGGYNTSLEKNLWKNAYKKFYPELDMAPADLAKN